MHVNRARVARKVVAPDEVEQLAALEYAAGMPRQERKQVELLWPQLDALGAKPHLMPLDVHLELPGAHELWLVGLGPRASQQRLRACDQLLRMEWFGEVVVGADLEPDDLVGHLVARGEHDDRDLALLADLLADGQPVRAGEHDVEDHQVGLDLAEAGDGLRAVPHALDLVALARQVEPRQLDDVLLVIDDEDLRVHRGSHGVKFITAASTGCLTKVSEM